MADVDLSEFTALNARGRDRVPCGVAVAVEELDGPSAEKLKAAVETDRTVISNAAIERWLKERGIKASAQIIASHRRGTCRCAL